MNTRETKFDDDPAEYQEEWLSAYLDGELTDAQRQTVEARLANDPAAQILLSDLEQIRGLVKQLPTWNGPTVAMSADMLAASPDDAHSPSVVEEHDIEDDDEVALALEANPAEVEWGEKELSAFWVQPKSSKSSWRWIRPLAVAASLLLMAGIGYVIWPKSSSMNMASTTRSIAPTDSILADGAIERGSSAFSGEPNDKSKVPSAALERSLGESPEPSSANAMPALPMPAVAADPELTPASAVPSFGANRQAPNRESADVETSDLADSDSRRMSKDEATMGGSSSGAVKALGRAEVEGILPEAPLEPSSMNRSRSLNEAAAKLDISHANMLPGAGVAMAGKAAKPLELRIARSDQWSDSALANELATNPALAGMQSASNADPTTVNSSTNDLPASIVLASLPSSEDAEAFFDNAVAQNGLTAVVNRSNSSPWDSEPDINALPAVGLGGQSAQSSSAEASALNELSAPTAELVRDPQNSERKRSDVKSIVLFLNYEEAQRLLKLVQEKSPAGSKANYSWIKPATSQAIESDSRVVLVLNPTAD